MRIIQYLIRHKINFWINYIDGGMYLKWGLSPDKIYIMDTGDVAYYFIDPSTEYVYNKLDDTQRACEYVECMVRAHELKGV